MVQIVHEGDNQERIQNILKVGYKFFSLYGFEKTTMKDIANELGFSKGSLYYYFTDKDSLFKAIVENSQQDFIKEIAEKLKSCESPLEKLKEYNKQRLFFFKSILNMNQVKVSEYRSYSPDLKQLWVNFREQEIEIIESILKEGAVKNEKVDFNLREMAELFIDILKGLRNIQIARKDILSIDDNEYKLIFNKSNLFAEVFIKGCLKSN